MQRVTSASVTVGGEVVGAISEPGLLAYVGVTHSDGPAEVAWMARKLWGLRVLRDEQSLAAGHPGVPAADRHAGVQLPEGDAVRRFPLVDREWSGSRCTR